MKKLISLLGAMSLTATAAIAVVACSPQLDGKDYDKLVGTGIDRSNALDDSNLENDLGITNFYTIGDSLSDSGGIETLATKAISQILNLVHTISDNPVIQKELVSKLIGMLESILGKELGPLKTVIEKILYDLIEKGKDIPNIEVELQLLKSDGSTPVETYQHSFTDSKTAAVLLSEQLGFNEEGKNSKKFNAGVKTNILGFSVESEQYKEGALKPAYNGNNYAIGGATASTVEGMTGMLLNAVQIQDQAVALLQQHKTKPTDLVFMEIGGNDLFSMITLYENGGSEKEIQTIMDEALNNIKTALLTLLNNGVTKIIVANAPDVSQIPRYVHLEGDKAHIKQKAHELSMEFNQRFIEQFNEINNKFGNTMELYDLGQRFNELLVEFQKEQTEQGKNAIIDKPSVTLAGEISLDKSDDETWKVQIKNKTTVENPEEYFFWDTIHPNSWAHEKVTADLYGIAEKMFAKQ